MCVHPFWFSVWFVFWFLIYILIGIGVVSQIVIYNNYHWWFFWFFHYMVKMNPSLRFYQSIYQFDWIVTRILILNQEFIILLLYIFWLLFYFPYFFAWKYKSYILYTKSEKKQIFARNFIGWNLSHYYHFQYFHSYFHFLVQYLYCVVEIVVKNMLFHLQHLKFKLW